MVNNTSMDWRTTLPSTNTSALCLRSQQLLQPAIQHLHPAQKRKHGSQVAGKCQINLLMWLNSMWCTSSKPKCPWAVEPTWPTWPPVYWLSASLSTWQETPCTQLPPSAEHWKLSDQSALHLSDSPETGIVLIRRLIIIGIKTWKLAVTRAILWPSGGRGFTGSALPKLSDKSCTRRGLPDESQTNSPSATQPSRVFTLVRSNLNGENGSFSSASRYDCTWEGGREWRKLPWLTE